MPSKFVVIGDVDGKFKEVFSKIDTLHAKNSFSQAIITGNLFAHPATATEEDERNVSSLLRGEVKVPLPTYFMLGTSKLPEEVIEALEKSGGQVCENLHFLGKRSITRTLDGVRIVALGGQLDPQLVAGNSKDDYIPFHSANDAKALRGANNTDILITAQWPQDIEAGSQGKPSTTSGEKPVGSKNISDLCSALKPRYFFTASSSTFFEREPFSHPAGGDDSSGHFITRFISLAPFGNAEKLKWIYAFTLDPSAPRPGTLPAGITASPFSLGTRKRRDPLTDQHRFFLNSGASDSRPQKRQKQSLDASQCFFCISNPNVAQHLITSIGEEAYLTTAKGPLSARDTFPDLDFPCHMLIIPMAHAPTISRVPEPESRKMALAEMLRYRNALNDMLSKRAGGRLGAVTWEVSKSGNMHTHWQYFPMPADMVSKGLVETAFKVQAENEKYPAFTVSKDSTIESDSADCFRLWLWSPDHSETNVDSHFSMPLDGSFRFDMQFGRRVLAKLLDMEHRSHWRDCDQTETEETEDAEAFKKAFEPFDFAA